MHDIFIRHLIEIAFMWAVIAIERRHNHIAVAHPLALHILLQRLSSKSNIAALPDHLILEIARMLRHNKGTEFLAIILLERLCDLLCRLAATLFISEHENHAFLRESRREHRIHRRHQHVKRFVIHRHNYRMVHLARLREIPLFRRRHHAKIAQMLLMVIGVALRTSQAIIAFRRILKLREALRPIYAHPALQQFPTLHRANRNSNALHEVHNHNQKQINRCDHRRN